MIANWLRRAVEWLKTQVQQEDGQGLVEYALLLIFVSVVIIAILAVLAPGLNNTYSSIVQTL